MHLAPRYGFAARIGVAPPKALFPQLEFRRARSGHVEAFLRGVSDPVYVGAGPLENAALTEFPIAVMATRARGIAPAMQRLRSHESPSRPDYRKTEDQT
jgi:hypothetical protein